MQRRLIRPINVFPDQVYKPLLANSNTLASQLDYCLQSIDANPLDPLVWEAGRYKPTPTIIEAAQALYKGHNVTEITRSDSGAINLSETSNAIDSIITKTKYNHQKAICFITGVPGAGKTLAGLNIANHRLQMGPDEHAVFLSGNGPLVTVLQEVSHSGRGHQGGKRGGLLLEKREPSSKIFIIFAMNMPRM